MTESKPVLILQLRPEDEASDNEFDSILKYAELDRDKTTRIRIEQSGIPDLSLDDYAAIIVGGSPFDISTAEEKKSLVQVDIERWFARLFQEIVGRDFPFLGACSGCGLLGSYIGAPISNKYAEPVGGATVSLTNNGKEDPLLADFPDQIRVLTGHKEACDFLPDGATLLLTSDACPVEMFRVGKNVYATQFHPEGDADGFILRINAYKYHGYFSPDDAERLVFAISQVHTPNAHEILRRFVARYAR